MAISDEFLNELRERTDIESLISQYVNLSKRGRNPKGLCPFHNEKHRPLPFIPRASRSIASVAAQAATQ